MVWERRHKGAETVRTVGRIGVIVLGLALATSAYSATWYVEKDGSGDFEVIQDAVDVAAPGDVIMVGPGRYEEFQVYFDGNSDWHIYVLVETDDLTIIGSGPESTIIGPVDDSVNIRYTIGVANLYMPQFRMERIAVENMKKFGLSPLKSSSNALNNLTP